MCNSSVVVELRNTEVSNTWKDVFDKPSTTTKSGKTPTLNQFLRKLGKKKMPDKNLVFLIWTPGEFDNFTLETELFRVIIRRGHELYHALDDFTSDPETANVPLAITVTDRAKGEFSIVGSEEQGAWTEVGANGYKWKN
jgi:hypothetical protein